MAKLYKPIAVVLLLFVVGIAYVLFMNKPVTLVQETGQKEEQITLKSLGDVLSNNSLSVECHMVKGDTPQVAYIKNGQIRIDAIKNGSENAQGLLVTRDYMYAWTQRGGVKIALDTSAKASVEEFQKQVEKLAGNSGNDMIEELSKDKESCKNTFVDDSHFVPPSNIEYYNIGSIPVGSFDKSE